MVLAIGQFRVSLYARSAGEGGAEGGGTGIPQLGGPIPGIPDAAGNYNLVPSNIAPQTILPGGEVLPGAGPSFLPGGVPVGSPAYPGAGGPGYPFWDPSTLPGTTRRGKQFGSRIVNINLPRTIEAGQPFTIITAFVHSGNDFGSYKIRVNIPGLQISDTSENAKKVGINSQSVIISGPFTAPSPMPPLPVRGTVELLDADGPDITVDSEVITIPSPHDIMQPAPVPEPVEEPPVSPPPPPVPLPPVLQLVNVNVTRGEDQGMQAVIIEASNLEPSEPTTLFIYLRDRRGVGHAWGQTEDFKDSDRWQQWRDRVVSTQTNAGSTGTATPTAQSNVAHAYPTVSIGGTTLNGSGLLTGYNYPSINTSTNTSNLYNYRTSLYNQIRTAVVNKLTSTGISTNISTSAGDAAAKTVASGGDATAAATASASAAAAAGGDSGATAAAAAAGGSAAAAAVAVSKPVVQPQPMPIPAPLPPPPNPIFKRQRITITASAEGTIRHVVRVREATPATPLFGFVIVYGNRSRKHTGRRQFSL